MFITTMFLKTTVVHQPFNNITLSNGDVTSYQYGARQLMEVLYQYHKRHLDQSASNA